MGYHPRIESTKIATFQTTRTNCSELWFVNNKKLEQEILGFAAKYAKRYCVKLYALSVEGNHIQFPALFPKANRAHFMRDFNSSVARCVPRHQHGHKGGKFWARRYSAEYLPGDQDIEEQFFYTVLQPVQDGLVDDIKDYPDYNCFEDAVLGNKRVFEVVRWKEYNDARRWDPKVSIELFTDEFELTYERLPGYTKLSAKAYEEQMRKKLKERTKWVLAERKFKRCLGCKALRAVKPGALPKNTKRSSATSHRPRVLSKDAKRRGDAKAWYFDIYFEYQEKSAEFRAGKLRVKFPKGTYRPPLFTVKHTQCMFHSGY